MTYVETLKEINDHQRTYQTFSDVFFPSFLEVNDIPLKKIADKEVQIKQLTDLLMTSLRSGSFSLDQKSDMMEYIDKLHLALEILAIKKGEKNIDDLHQAAKHLGKKMQSSFNS